MPEVIVRTLSPGGPPDFAANINACTNSNEATGMNDMNGVIILATTSITAKDCQLMCKEEDAP